MRECTTFIKSHSHWGCLAFWCKQLYFEKIQHPTCVVILILSPSPSNGQGNPEMLNVTLQFFCSKQFTFPLTLLLCVLEQAARIFLDKCTSHHPLSKSDPSFINNAEKTHLIQSRYSLEYVYGPESILLFSALSALTLEKLYSSSTNFTSCLQENPYYTYMHKQAESELAIHKAVYFTSSEHRRQRRHLSEPLSL